MLRRLEAPAAAERSIQALPAACHAEQHSNKGVVIHLEQDLDDLLEYGQEAAVVHTNAALEDAQHVAQRRQLPVSWAEHLEHVVVHLQEQQQVRHPHTSRAWRACDG